MKAATVTFDTELTIINGHHVAAVLRAAGMKPIYLATRAGWSLDRKRLPDAVAVLERAGFRVRILESGAR